MNDVTQFFMEVTKICVQLWQTSFETLRITLPSDFHEVYTLSNFLQCGNQLDVESETLDYALDFLDSIYLC